MLLLTAGAFGAPRDLNARLLPLGGLALGAAAYLVLARAGRAAESGAGEERFRRLVEGSWDGILLIDEETRIRFASEAMERILGFGATELNGRVGLDLVHPRDRARAEATLRSLVEQPRQPQLVELRGRRKDGSYRDLELTATNFLGEPSVRSIVINLRDVTDRNATVRRLRVMDYAIASSINAAALSDAEGHLTYVNDAFLRLWGYASADEVVGRSVLEFWETEEAPAKVVQFLAGHGSWVGEMVARRRDGSTFDAQISASRVLDDRGEPICMMGFFVDITERKRAENKLRQAASVFASTEDGVVITDPSGTILEVNDAFTEITGYSREEAVGGNPRVKKSDRHDAAFYAAFWKALRENGAWQGEIWNRRKNGEVYPEWLTVNAVRDETGRIVNYVAVFSDISGMKRSQAQLVHLAQHDPLTGLPNRLLFKDRLEHALSRAERSDSQLAVLFLDLDRFKHVNDTLGHAVGDQLLQEVSRRLDAAVRRKDTVARLGGDEFTILLEDLRRPEDAAVLAGKLLLALAEPCPIAGQELRVTSSIGISIHPRDGATAGELLAHADAAMYQAKGDGRDGYRFYTPELTAAALQRVRLESELRGAIERGELLVRYQPQLELGTRRLVGAEALVRWRHPHNGLIGPDHFIPVAEDTGLIIDIGGFVLREACLQAREWIGAGIGLETVAVNVSPTQIRRSDFVATVRAVLDETGLPPGRLELEVTEELIMTLAESGIDTLRALGELGVRLAVDDFGMGYSSLARLARLPVHRLKIDRSFVAELPGDDDAAAVARATVALAGSLGLEVVAEGVETPAQAALLQQDGCRYAQGFLFGRPAGAGEFARCWGATGVPSCRAASGVG